MKTFIGVKKIQAEPAERDGKPGYKVVYPGGYESWSPKDVFEKAYLLVDDSDRISMDVAERVCEAGAYWTATTKGKPALAAKYFITSFGFTMAEAVAPVPEDREKWREEERFKATVIARIWECLEFVRCWADNGLKRKEEDNEGNA